MHRAKNHQPRRGVRLFSPAHRGLAVCLLVAATAATSWGQPPAPPATVTPVPAASANRVETSLGVDRSRQGTEVPVPAELQALLTRGGVPADLDELRLLERQQQAVAKRAFACTVSVQIGPAQGCGVIITESGYVLSAAHVAMRPNKLAWITLTDGRKVRAKTLGMNRNVDAGLIKIEPGQNNGQPWPYASLGTSANLMEGMWCIATGHPGGYDLERGPVTRIGRILRVSENSLVTDCALIGGDSGGPLFDIAGRLIAVHSRIGNDVADNLHVPIDHYGESWDRMQSKEAWGFLPGFKPRLGVKGNKTADQAIVEVVAPDSPAEAAGMKVGDIVEQFGDVVISDFESLREAVADTMPGERVNVWINRGGNRRRLSVEVGRVE